MDLHVIDPYGEEIYYGDTDTNQGEYSVSYQPNDVKVTGLR